MYYGTEGGHLFTLPRKAFHKLHCTAHSEAKAGGFATFNSKSKTSFCLRIFFNAFGNGLHKLCSHGAKSASVALLNLQIVKVDGIANHDFGF